MPPGPSQSSRSLEAENELKHFLKVARPEWSCPRRRGQNDIDRVISKLRDIGVSDIESLMERVDKNTINDDLFDRGHQKLSREALESIRQRTPFIRSLEAADAPHIRQVGTFAPMPQMLSSKRLSGTGRSSSSGNCRSSPTRNSLDRGSLSSMSATHTGECGGSLQLRGLQPSRRKRGQLSSYLVMISAHSASEADKESPTNGNVSLATGCSGNHISISRDHATDDIASVSSTRGRRGDIDGGDSGESSPRSLTWAKTSKGLSSAFSEMSGRAGRHMNRSHTVMGLECPTPDERRGHAKVDAFDPVSVTEIERLQRAGLEMMAELPRARWASSRFKTPLQQGEDMLREQAALDDRDALVRTVLKRGEPLAFRSHIANNIRSRLEEERQRDGAVDAQHLCGVSLLLTQQQGMNIRKNLASMVNARRELAGLRSRVQCHSEVEEAEPPSPPVHQPDPILEHTKSLRSLHRQTPSGDSPVAEQPGKQQRNVKSPRKRNKKVSSPN